MESLENVIILGMARSGTSAAAGALITANPEYYSGGDFVPPRPSNPDGTFEPWSIRSINEDILAQVVPELPPDAVADTSLEKPRQWRWLAKIPVETPIPSTQSIEDRIKEQTQKTPFCLKDPRFSYTLDVWRPHLKNPVFVCMFRHPAEVAKSILRHNGEFELLKNFKITYEQALEVWALTYKHILEKHHPKGGKWLFLHLDQLITDDGMDRLADATGAKVNRSLINAKRIRTKFVEKVPPHIQSIYDQLCTLAGFHHD